MKMFKSEKIAEFVGLAENAFDNGVNPMPFNLRCALDIIAQLQAENARLVESLKCIASPGAYGTEVISKNVGPHDLVTVRITKAQVQAIVGEVAAAMETLK